MDFPSSGSRCRGRCRGRFRLVGLLLRDVTQVNTASVYREI